MRTLDAAAPAERPGQSGLHATFAALAAVSTAAFLFVLARDPFGRAATTWIDDLGTLTGATLAAVASHRAARRSAGRTRRAWRFVAAAATAWAFGNAWWATEELLLRKENLFPSWADAGFLSFTPLMVVALLLFLPRAHLGVFRIRALVDGLWTTNSVLLASWILVLRPVISAASEPAFATWLAFLYPFADVFIAAAAAALLTRSDTDTRTSIRLLGGGALTLAVADSGFAYFTTVGSYATGNLLDAGWLAGMLLLALAAVTYVQAPSPPAVAGASLRTVIGPYVPFGLAIIAAVGHAFSEGADRATVLLTTGAVGLLIARAVLTHLDNVRLTNRLEEALRSREVLIRTVAHDLKNPMSPLRIQAYILSARSDLPEAVRDSVRMIDRNVRQMDVLIGDLQDLSALESGRLGIEFSDVDLARLVREAVEGFRAAAAEVRDDVEVRGPDRAPARADPRRLGQVLSNLLSNAVKFSPPEGRIEVVLARTDGAYQVDVSDHGRGIDPADLPRLFRPFGRLQPADAPKVNGTGLGLYICKGIVEGHRGRIWVTSAGRGRGSTFSFTVPAPP